MHPILHKRFDPILIELLPDKARTDFEFWQALIEPLLDGRPSEGVEAALDRIARETGKAWKTVRNRYYRARKYGLNGLIDLRLCGPKFWAGAKARMETYVSLCPGLQALFRKLCEDNQRNSYNAWLQLMKLWKERDAQIAAIPEYAEFPQWPQQPSGWSYQNLMRFAPEKFEKAAARLGRTAAHPYRPCVYTTRVGLWVGSHYLFDDKWHDLFVNSFTHRQAGRPLEVYSMDLFSACKRRWATRIRTKDEEGNYKGVAEVMMRFVLAATLHQDGYSRRGTTILSEHGTAAVREALARKLRELTGGLVIVHESGMTGDPAHMGQYPGLVRGNPRHKAALESNNNLEHNRLQHLPGQTGRSVATRPEELAGRLEYNATLLAAYGQLTPQRAAMLDFPLLEYFQYVQLASEVYAAIADSRDHDLEGWIECGHVVQQFQWGGQPLLETSLTPEQRAQVPALLSAGILQAQPVRMSRREVWDQGAGELIRLPGAGVCAILGDDLAREVRCTRGEIEICDAEVSPSPLHYERWITDHHGHLDTLKDGEVYQAFVNPFALNTLFVRDARGAYLGECRRIVAASRADTEAVQRAIGEASKREANLLQPLRARHMQEARERLARHRHNTTVLAPATSGGADAMDILLSRESAEDPENV